MKKLLFFVFALLVGYKLFGAYNRTELLTAAQDGNVSLLFDIFGIGNLGTSVDVNVTENGNTALILASRAGHTLAVQTLLSERPNLNVVDNDHQTALMNAVKNGHIGVATLLLKAGADANIPDNFNKTPLYYAMLLYKQSNPALAELLRSYNARLEPLSQ